MKRSFLIAFLGAVFFYSCKKVIDLDLHDARPYLVIEGEVTDLAGPYTVKITRSVPFAADNTYPAVVGAVVKISDNTGFADTLAETAPGIYTSHNLQGKPGNTYTMTALVQDTTYTAVSTMPIPVVFDSVTFIRTKAFGIDAISARPNFQDPAGIHNYYQFIEYLNGAQLTKDIFVFDDRLSDGRYVSFSLFNDTSYIQPHDTLEMKMYGIDKPIYDYFNSLALSAGTGGAFNTTASPANPLSNISNGALGYFSAHTSRSIKKVVDLP